jgi:hypothetical protein
LFSSAFLRVLRGLRGYLFSFKMNYFAHGYRFVHEPFFLAGTAVPDWLSVVDRGVRVSSKKAKPFVDVEDPPLAAVAAGIVQHHADDDRFHRTPTFIQLSMQFAAEIRDRLASDDGFRPSLLGHILVEILLDAELILEYPQELDAYYSTMDALDVAEVSRAVNCMANRSTELLGPFIPRFSAERFLYDYAEDGKLLMRLNRVMRRVGLAELPEQFHELLPGARDRVRAARTQLLGGAFSQSDDAEADGGE